MKLTTRVFGEIEIDDSKILTFPSGIIGFPDLQRFVILYDEEQGSDTIKWLQSIEEPGFAMPVINPLQVKEDYNPQIEDEILTPIGGLVEDEMIVFVTMTIPHDLTKMTVNLRGPIIINSETCKGCQVILDSDDYKVKFPIYDILMAKQGKAGDQ